MTDINMAAGRHSSMHPLAADAHSVGVWRECAHGDAVSYEGVVEGVGYSAVRTIVHAAAAAGYLTGPVELANDDPWWGTLDIYDADHALIDGYHIPSRDAWEWWQHAAELRLVSADCDTCTA